MSSSSAPRESAPGSGRRIKRRFAILRRSVRELYREFSRLRKRANHKKAVLLVGYRLMHPDWDDAKIVRIVGCDESYPAKIPQYAAIVAFFKGSGLEFREESQIRKMNGKRPDS